MEGIDENEEAVQPSLDGGNLGIDIDTYEQSHTVNNNNGEILTEINEKRTEAKASGQKTEKTHNFKEQSIVLPKHRINAIRVYLAQCFSISGEDNLVFSDRFYAERKLSDLSESMLKKRVDDQYNKNLEGRCTCMINGKVKCEPEETPQNKCNRKKMNNKGPNIYKDGKICQCATDGSYACREPRVSFRDCLIINGNDENEEAVQPSLDGRNLGIDIDTYEQSHTVNNNNGEILTEINEKRTEAKASGQKTEKTHNFKEQSIVFPKHRINAIRASSYKLKELIKNNKITDEEMIEDTSDLEEFFAESPQLNINIFEEITQNNINMENNKSNTENTLKEILSETIVQETAITASTNNFNKQNQIQSIIEACNIALCKVIKNESGDIPNLNVLNVHNNQNKNITADNEQLLNNSEQLYNKGKTMNKIPLRLENTSLTSKPTYADMLYKKTNIDNNSSNNQKLKFKTATENETSSRVAKEAAYRKVNPQFSQEQKLMIVKGESPFTAI
ncbi:hypothetical protein BB561_000465 [Smittium simulii]|uniref:Uncharacterized protein n=1 Tax=Smittium simulii TaxID=133385 RepID=A0A2T9YZ39_9FUNG|nr:hypothetical protein BB561_000465 [Smittium simulii]